MIFLFIICDKTPATLSKFFKYTGDSLYLYVGEKIPHLKSRVFKSSGDGQGANQSGGGKKKGKGGRR